MEGDKRRRAPACKREAGQHLHHKRRCLAPACVLGYCAIFFVIFILLICNTKKGVCGMDRRRAVEVVAN